MTWSDREQEQVFDEIEEAIEQRDAEWMAAVEEMADTAYHTASQTGSEAWH